VQYLQVDVTDEKQVEHAFHMVMKRSGRLDLVVNTVGGYLPAKPICDVSEAEWDSMITMNLKSAFLCTREAARRMKSVGEGRIVNISALASVRPSLNRAPYVISKSGVNLLTELAAQELKGSGISVFAIAPSIIDTEANRASMPHEDRRAWVSPEEIADLIVFLSSAHGASLTGTVFKMGG
jgi:NAD(P)-dependent dehydrogenase (short-subunit alcohol dehydrogenase family)